MNKKEKLAVQTTQEYVRRLLKQRNAGTEDCITSSELARDIGIPVADLHQFLIDKKVLCRKNRELQMTARYANRGLAKRRSCFKYRKTGELLEIVFPVWTPKGVEFMEKMLNIKIEK